MSLTVKNQINASATKSFTVNVNNTAPKIKEINQINVSKSEKFPLTIEIDDKGNDTHKYKIDWGDGNSIQLKNAFNKLISEEHTYLAAGSKEIKITVFDSKNLSDEFLLPVTITECPENATNLILQHGI